MTLTPERAQNLLTLLVAQFISFLACADKVTQRDRSVRFQP
jgi:hypothetical protein